MGNCIENACSMFSSVFRDPPEPIEQTCACMHTHAHTPRDTVNLFDFILVGDSGMLYDSYLHLPSN